jgi:DNA repair protein RecN (Recombination protein N)
MLTRLVINNYAIIPHLDVQFADGLTIITGETGAGKSILLGALGLALGKRAETKVLPDETAKCIVEAHFKLEDDSLRRYFEKEDLNFDRELICRREIGQGGRSRSFINDSAVSLKTLQEITSAIVELHHQHDNLALQSKGYQTNVLDSISQSKDLFAQYHTLYADWISAKEELKRIKEIEQSSARKKEFLQFQIDELSQAKLVPGEVAVLEENQSMLENAEAIKQSIYQLRSSLQDGPHSINQQLTALIKQIHPVAQVFAPIAEVNQRLEVLRLEIQDLALESSRMESPGGNDPAKLAKIESRLSQLYSLIKKYHCSDETQLIGIYDELTRELEMLSSSSEIMRDLEEKIKSLQLSLTEVGKQLQSKRKAGVKKFIPKISSLLHELGMPNAQVDIAINALTEPSPTGLDDIQFMFSANKGMSLQPLHAVASGGELSRLSLAIKSIYAKEAELPTIIFDEIDTGISGEVAWRMGQLIRVMSKGHQILMITHSPQIAAHAEHQFHVSKITDDKKDISSIQHLTNKQRVNEIAKMLSGDPPSSAAIKNAEGLMKKVTG